MTKMSKLKRKKPAVENCKLEQQPIIKKTNESLCSVQESHVNKTHTGSSAGGAVSWWERNDLNDVERIWALTLKTFCPSLHRHQEERVPPLPPLSSMLPQKASVEKLSDWRWSSPKDITDIPDLPRPSFLIHRHPVNDPSSCTTVQDTVKSGPTGLTNQKICESIQEDVSICDLEAAQHQHTEGHVLSDKQSDTIGPAGKVSQRWEMEYHEDSRAIEMCSALRETPSSEVAKEIKVNPVHRYGHNSSEGKRSVSDTQVVAGPSGAGLDVKSEAGGSKMGTKQSAGGSGTWLKTKSGGSGTGIKTKSRAGGSGTGMKTKSAAGGSKSGLGTQSKAGGSGSKFKTKSGESGLDLETKPGAEGSKSELECCPMCLMPFPEGFSQMECDGHLAQCLSEMNEDIIW